MTYEVVFSPEKTRSAIFSRAFRTKEAALAAIAKLANTYPHHARMLEVRRVKK